jgi:hypothetical protein
VLLVDYESVQEVDFARLPDDASLLLVLGAKNTKVPADLLIRQQDLGARFRIAAIRRVQPNAADFCVAYYLGEQLASEPDTPCVILSKDKKAFDPLIDHLRDERGLPVRRVDTFSQAFPKTTMAKSAAVSSPDLYRRVVELLAKERQRPKTRKGLTGKLKSWLPNVDDAARAAVLERLFADGSVAVDGASLTYRL